jgi:ribosomal protein L12E/L44/L45/RPP1/RPP2
MRKLLIVAIAAAVVMSQMLVGQMPTQPALPGYGYGQGRMPLMPPNAVIGQATPQVKSSPITQPPPSPEDIYAFMKACEAVSESDVQRYLAMPNFNINVQRPADGATGLMLAAKAGFLKVPEIVVSLINAGANIYIKDNAGRTALNWAIDGIKKSKNGEIVNEMQQLVILAQLLREPVDWSAVDSALADAMKIGAKRIAYYLRGHTGSYMPYTPPGVMITQQMRYRRALNRDALFNPSVPVGGLQYATPQEQAQLAQYVKAISTNNLEEVKRFIEEEHIPGDAIISGNKTALMLAIEAGHLDVVQYLVEHNANVNLFAGRPFSPLMLAAQAGYLDIIQYLIAHGADIDAQGLTALKLAAIQMHPDVITYLIKQIEKKNVKKALDAVKALIKTVTMKRDQASGANALQTRDQYTEILTLLTDKQKQLETSIATAKKKTVKKK